MFIMSAYGGKYLFSNTQFVLVVTYQGSRPSKRTSSARLYGLLQHAYLEQEKSVKPASDSSE